MATPNPTPRSNIRFAKFSELYACAQTLEKAFLDDVLFGRHIHPYRHEYPGDMALFWYRSMLVEWFDWSMVFLISTENDVNGYEVITGVALWHRIGDSSRRRGWGLAPWDPRNLLTPLSTAYVAVASYMSPNRAIVPSKADILERADPFTEHLFTGSRSERWYLHFLGVHPDHQNKGLGRRLVAWGLDQAQSEGVSACVVAAHGKDTFYSRCGFKEILGRAGDGEGNPLGPIPGGNIWWVNAQNPKEKIAKASGESDGNVDEIV